MQPTSATQFGPIFLWRRFQMTNPSYFWAHFEEPSSANQEKVDLGVGTQTRTREERDQRSSALNCGTETFSKTREERDQDPGHDGFSAVPRQSPLLSTKTKTLTETREERDQDAHHGGFCVVPRQPNPTSGQTMTKTATREEPDQDASGTKYGALPPGGMLS